VGLKTPTASKYVLHIVIYLIVALTLIPGKYISKSKGVVWMLDA